MPLKYLNKIYILLLLLFTIWLPTHRYLVTNYDLNPWKLGGLSMFCNLIDTKISVDAYKNGKHIQIDQKKLSRKNQNGHYILYNKFNGLGRLYQPDKYLQEIKSELEVDSLVLFYTNTKIISNLRKKESFTYKYVAK